MMLRKFRSVANLCASGLKHRHILNIVMTSYRTHRHIVYIVMTSQTTRFLETHIRHSNDVINNTYTINTYQTL